MGLFGIIPHGGSFGIPGRVVGPRKGSTDTDRLTVCALSAGLYNPVWSPWNSKSRITDTTCLLRIFISGGDWTISHGWRTKGGGGGGGDGDLVPNAGYISRCQKNRRSKSTGNVPMEMQGKRTNPSRLTKCQFKLSQVWHKLKHNLHKCQSLAKRFFDVKQDVNYLECEKQKRKSHSVFGFLLCTYLVLNPFCGSWLDGHVSQEIKNARDRSCWWYWSPSRTSRCEFQVVPSLAQTRTQFAQMSKPCREFRQRKTRWRLLRTRQTKAKVSQSVWISPVHLSGTGFILWLLIGHVTQERKNDHSCRWCCSPAERADINKDASELQETTVTAQCLESSPLNNKFKASTEARRLNLQQCQRQNSAEPRAACVPWKEDWKRPNRSFWWYCSPSRTSKCE